MNPDGSDRRVVLDDAGGSFLEVANARPEPGLAGWVIYLDQNDNGARDPGERFTTTDANGDYAFGGLAPGSYIVREELREGWQHTTPLAESHELTIVGSEVFDGINFGNRRTTPTDAAWPCIREREWLFGRQRQARSACMTSRYAWRMGAEELPSSPSRSQCQPTTPCRQSRRDPRGRRSSIRLGST
jgi:hypothetical protein